jgi:hypothetical protein
VGAPKPGGPPGVPVPRGVPGKGPPVPGKSPHGGARGRVSLAAFLQFRRPAAAAIRRGWRRPRHAARKQGPPPRRGLARVQKPYPRGLGVGAPQMKVGGLMGV